MYCTISFFAIALLRINSVPLVYIYIIVHIPLNSRPSSAKANILMEANRCQSFFMSESAYHHQDAMYGNQSSNRFVNIMLRTRYDHSKRRTTYQLVNCNYGSHNVKSTTPGRRTILTEEPLFPLDDYRLPCSARFLLSQYHCAY
jgi:hypothetical protein